MQLISSKTELNNDLYFKIQNLFKLLLEQTKKPENELTAGLDGVTYYFARTDKSGSIKIGKTWSPDCNSLLGRIVEICDNIYSLGKGHNLSQTEILNDINVLLDDLKQ